MRYARLRKLQRCGRILVATSPAVVEPKPELDQADLSLDVTTSSTWSNLLDPTPLPPQLKRGRGRPRRDRSVLAVGRAIHKISDLEIKGERDSPLTAAEKLSMISKFKSLRAAEKPVQASIDEVSQQFKVPYKQAWAILQREI